MKVVVTGGAGFIGSHVVDAYLTAGWEVAVIDTLTTGRQEYVNPRARFHQMDVASPEIAEIFAQERPEVLNHHAAQASVSRSVQEPVEDGRVNALGIINLLQHAIRAGVRKVVYASTGGALYGEPDRIPADEDHPIRPLSPYGTSKYVGELYLGLYRRLAGLRSFILRYANVYGPRQDPHGEAGVVAIFAGAMLAGRSPTIFGDGRQTRDFVYVDDVARANLLATDTDAEGAVNIGTGVETTVNEIHTRLAALTGWAAAPVLAPPREGDVYRIALDAARAARVLGWRPQVDLQTGLRRTAEWFSAR